MTFIEHDAMIQAFSPKATDDPLHIAVLPRTTGSDWQVLHAETEHALLKMMAIDPVAIPDQKAWRWIPGKSFNKLLRCPNRCWMFCHIKALAYGCPAVSTDCPSGPSEILDDGRIGKLVAIGDVDGLSAAMLATLDSPPPRAEQRERARHFDAGRTVEGYLNVLAGVLPNTR